MTPTDIQGIITDLDGVLYRTGQLLPHAAHFVTLARRAGVGIVALTNHAGHDAAAVAEKLTRMGLPWQPEHVLTPVEVAARHLLTHHSHSSVWVLGSAALARGLKAQGVRVLPVHTRRRPDIVLVGYTTRYTHALLERAALYLRGGARLLATNRDRTLPTPGGLRLEVGPLVAFLEDASGEHAEVLGKPSPDAYLAALERLNVPAGRALMIGDTLYTDIRGARLTGMRSALVLTGNTTRTDLIGAQDRPDTVAEHLGELARQLFTSVDVTDPHLVGTRDATV